MKNICDHRRVLSFLGWVRAGMGKPAWLAPQGALLSLRLVVDTLGWSSHEHVVLCSLLAQPFLAQITGLNI